MTCTIDKTHTKYGYHIATMPHDIATCIVYKTLTKHGINFSSNNLHEFLLVPSDTVIFIQNFSTDLCKKQILKVTHTIETIHVTFNRLCYKKYTLLGSSLADVM